MPLVRSLQITKRRKSTINRLLIILVIFMMVWPLSPALSAVPVQEPQTSEVRQLDEAKIKELKESGDFDYVESKDAPPSLMQRFLNFLNRLISSLFQATGSPVGKLFMYVFLFALLLIAIINIFKIKVRDVFYGTSDKGKSDFEFLEENIHDLDFNQLLEDALKKQDYRLAVRLEYLKTLRAMNEANLIEWQPGKTNYEYLYELSQETLRTQFKDLCYYFDYGWYGDFVIDKPLYEKAHLIAKKLIEKVTREEVAA